jgi:hypothetical protein
MRSLAIAFVLSLVVLSACVESGEDLADDRASVALPRLVGEELEPAARRLEALDLRTQARARFSSRPRGTVVAQHPRPGERVPPGSSVTLSVSRGRASGPYGELRAEGVGPLEVGAPGGRVLETFGPPDRREQRNLGIGPTPEVDWLWRLRGGDEFALHFDARSRKLTGYCTDSPRLATADGLRVGAVSGGMLARRYGDRIVPARIGPRPGPRTYALLLSAGRPGSYPALAFTVSPRSTVISICGGRRPPAGD